jgi:hypothetical protein
MADRRFYIHEGSFRDLCNDFPAWQAATVEALALALADRMTYHHLIANGEKLGLVPDGTFTSMVKRLDKEIFAQLSELFHALVFAPADQPRNDEVRPLLARQEQVEATCWEAGYFTFATGKKSSDVMFRETGSLRALRAEVRIAPHLYPDLTIISGRRLYPFSVTAGLGPGTRRDYDELRGQAEPVVSDTNKVVDRVVATLNRSLTEVPAGSVEGVLADRLVEAARTAVGRLAERLGGEDRD